MPQPPHDAVTWFEIPTTDLDRATHFYEQMLDTKLDRAVFGDPMAIFPCDPKGVGGALVHRPGHAPAGAGSLVYLNAGDRLEAAIDRVAELGGSILVPKTSVPGGPGQFAVLRDTEGNHVGLHRRERAIP